MGWECDRQFMYADLWKLSDTYFSVRSDIFQGPDLKVIALYTSTRSFKTWAITAERFCMVWMYINPELPVSCAGAVTAAHAGAGGHRR